MLTERRILEINSSKEDSPDSPEDIRLTEAAQKLTMAFLMEETLGFEKAVDAFLKDVQYRSLVRNQNASEAELEAYVIHVIPDTLFDTLPKTVGRYTLKYTGSTELINVVDARKPHSLPLFLEKKELRAAMRRIREAIQQRLKRQNMEDIYIVDKQFDVGHASALHGEAVYKRGLPVSDGERIEQTKAMRALYALPETSPFLMYPATTVDRREDRYIGRQIRSKLDFISLKNFISQEPRPPFYHALGAFCDAIKGVVFLYEHGLSITDLDLSNLGVLPSGRGMLFDFDTLLQAEDVSGYYAKPRFTPPDRDDLQAWGIPFRHVIEDAAYELGLSLEYLLRAYAFPVQIPSLLTQQLEDLSIQLQEPVPKKRPQLKAVIRELDDLVFDLAKDVQDEAYVEERQRGMPDQKPDTESPITVPDVSSPFAIKAPASVTSRRRAA